jgi:hypothetical protein
VYDVSHMFVFIGYPPLQEAILVETMNTRCLHEKKFVRLEYSRKKCLMHYDR